MEADYIVAFENLTAELADGCRLSTKVFPECMSTVIMETLHELCQSDNPIRTSVLDGYTTDIGTELANNQISASYAGKIDGAGIVAYVLAVLLFEVDKNNQLAREKASNAGEEEFDIVVSSTDTIPVHEDADPLQKALISFLKSEKLEDCVEKLALAAYGRTESYEGKMHVLKSCNAFLDQTKSLFIYNETILFDGDEPDADASLLPTMAPSVENAVLQIELNKAERPVMVDRASSPVQELYQFAEHPIHFFSKLSLADSSADSPPLIPASLLATPADSHEPSLIPPPPPPPPPSPTLSEIVVPPPTFSTISDPPEPPTPRWSGSVDDFFASLKSSSPPSPVSSGAVSSGSDNDFDDELRKILGV